MRVLLLLVIATLTGCADDAPQTTTGEGVEATATTGGIRGVVVDNTIVPVEGATVAIATLGVDTLTTADGTFLFSGLQPGTYFLQVTRIGYEQVQVSAIVEAGVEHPPSVTVQLPRIPGADPSLTTAQFDGYYECAFALFFITDSCDFGVRTVHDETGVGPRNIQNNVNTAFYPLEQDVQTVILEGFFNEDEVARMWFSIADTPIDNACDCSDEFGDVITDTGYGLVRVDKDGSFPSTERDFAVRGFLPFTEPTEASYAAGFGFQFFTTKFHNYQAPEGWNFVEQDSFPTP